MSGELFIILQGVLAFGAPLTLAFIELYKLRRKTPAPVGGGEPNVIVLAPRQKQAATLPVEPANADGVIKRAA